MAAALAVTLGAVSTQALAITIVAPTIQSNVVVFDGSPKAGGTIQTGLGTGTNGSDVWGSTLSFGDFNVTAGSTANKNLAGNGFNTGQVTMSSSMGVYQDLSPGNGGLGAFTTGGSGDTDNLDPNLNNFRQDEVLFFNFDSDVILDTVWFNGNHSELTYTEAGRNDTMFNIFASTNGVNYTSMIGGQKVPTSRDFLDVNLSQSFQFFAVAASGWGSAPGGYVEAIGYTAVAEPGTLALFGLGLIGLATVRRRA